MPPKRQKSRKNTRLSGPSPLDQLPVELLERILRHLEVVDFKSLRSAALVNSHWKLLSQPLIFERILVSVDEESPDNFPSCLLPILRRKKSLIPTYIKHLRVELASDSGRDAEELDDLNDIISILLQRSTITSLTLFSWETWQWDFQDTYLKPVLKEFPAKAKSLRCIRILDGQVLTGMLVDELHQDAEPLELEELEIIRSELFVQLGIPGAFKGEKLYFHGGTAYSGDDFKRVDPDRGSPPRVHVEKLTLIDATFPPSPNVLFETVDMSRVKHLRINRPSSSLANRVFVACQDSMEHLTIYDDVPSDPSGAGHDTDDDFSTPPPSEMVPISFDFGKSLCLESISIYVILLPYGPDVSVVAESLKCLGHMSFPARLRRISITVLIALDDDKSVESATEWIKTNLTPLDTAIFTNLNQQGHTIQTLDVELARLPAPSYRGKEKDRKSAEYRLDPETMPYMASQGVLLLRRTRDASEDEIERFRLWERV